MGDVLTLLDVHDAVRHTEPKSVIRLMGLGAWVLLGRVGAPAQGWTFRTGEGGTPMPPSADGTGFFPDTQLWPLLPKRSRTGARVSPPLLLGRSRNNDIIINHVSISKLHARIHVEDSGVSVEDASSRNGTSINGRVVTDTRPVLLHSMDLLTVGTVVLTLFATPALMTALRAKAILDGR